MPKQAQVTANRHMLALTFLVLMEELTLREVESNVEHTEARSSCPTAPRTASHMISTTIQGRVECLRHHRSEYSRCDPGQRDIPKLKSNLTTRTPDDRIRLIVQRAKQGLATRAIESERHDEVFLVIENIIPAARTPVPTCWILSEILRGCQDKSG